MSVLNLPSNAVVAFLVLPFLALHFAGDRAYSGDGEKQADFFDCVFWRQGAEFVSKYFNKGKEIIVTGEMQSRKWTDKDGNNRISWEIQNCHAEFCGSAKATNGTAQNDTAQPVGTFE